MMNIIGATDKTVDTTTIMISNVSSLVMLYLPGASQTLPEL